MKHSAITVLICAIMAVLMPIAAVSQVKPSTPSESKTFQGLEINVVSFTQSRGGSIGGACPPAKVTGFVNVIMQKGFILANVTVKVKVLPDYKGAKVAKALLEADSGEPKKTLTDLADFANPGGAREYECRLQFSVPEGPVYRKLRIETVSFDLPQPVK